MSPQHLADALPRSGNPLARRWRGALAVHQSTLAALWQLRVRRSMLTGIGQQTAAPRARDWRCAFQAAYMHSGVSAALRSLGRWVWVLGYWSGCARPLLVLLRPQMSLSLEYRPHVQLPYIPVGVVRSLLAVWAPSPPSTIRCEGAQPASQPVNQSAQH